MSKTTTHPLSPDHLETQLNTIDLLLAMYPDPGEIDIAPNDISLISIIRDDPSHPTPPSISLALQISIDSTHNIQLNITIPLQTSSPNEPEAPPITFVLRQPNWLDKSSVAKLSSQLPQDLFSALETLREEGAHYIPTVTSNTTDPNSDAVAPLHRVWFYFPSLSTRSKRADMVTWAPAYTLTGFVLAGKPGLLCLEGTSTNIDAYMNEIKTVSWSDIPSYQKKVSERYREMEVQRVFEGMQEITDVGAMHGARGNRGDMRALEGWLRERGLGTAFESVILQSA